MPDIRMPVSGSSPAQPPLNEVILYAKASDKRFYVKDDTGVEVKLVTNESTLTNLNVQTPLISTGGASPTLTISNATPTADGAMRYQDKLRLDEATANNSASKLVVRDSLGNASFNEVSATSFKGTATNVLTAPALIGQVTSNGTSNTTTITASVINNSHIASNANIALTKLALLPTDRSNHIGTQSASSISDFNTAVDSHLSSDAPIVNSMINSAAAIELTKLALNPLSRANHTGTQAVSTLSDFTAQTNAAVGTYLNVNPISNANISPTASISLNKLASNPLDRDNHTGTQLAVSISDFTIAAQRSITSGNGIDVISGVVSAKGVVNRISVSSAGINIDTAYTGQNSIVTLGTVSTGTWNANTIGITKGGTGAVDRGSAKNSLMAVNVLSTSTILDSTYNIILADATSGVITLNLPTASTRAQYTIKKIDASSNNVVVNIATGSGDDIEGNSSKTITVQYKYLTFVSNLIDKWFIIAQN